MLYPLDEVLLLSLCGVVSGCESFVDVALYGEEKLGFSLSGGAVVTPDAMEREIAAKICGKGADYVLALKGNQVLLHEDVKLWFEERDQENTESLQSVDGDKGRIETRTYAQCDTTDWLQKHHPQWEGLAGIGRVVPVRESGGKTTRRTRYFISSLPKDAAHFSHAIRSHLGIENRLHRVLDVTFRDDDSRVRKDTMLPPTSRSSSTSQ